MRLAPPFRGQLTAAAFVVETALIGEAEARRRVLAYWAKGATLRWLDGGRWLLTLPEPVAVRSELAPGYPLVRAGGGYASPDAGAVPPGVVRLPTGGRLVEREVAAMPYVDVAAWVRTDDLVRTPLRPVEPPPPRPVPPAPPDPPSRVDLRARAGVAPPSPQAARAREQLRRTAGKAFRQPVGARPAKAPLRDLMARAVLRSPAAGQVHRRHQKYLEDLERRLRAGDYDALRDAISMAGGGAFLSLRLPGRRDALRASPRLAGGGGAVPWGPSVWEHLSEVYRATATRLEREGRHTEAAFVLADLLDVPREAVALLERHRMYVPAAELAEGRGLEPAITVRLWWRGGRRDRAVDVARAHGAFAEAVRLAAEIDPALAGELRAEWAGTRAAADAYVGAVEAAWPDPALRVRTLPWIQAGMAAGGSVAAHLMAYLVALHPTPEARSAAVALASSHDPATRAARDAFLSALAAVPIPDRAADREVASAAVRAVVRAEPSPLWGDQAARGVVRALRERADPLLRADLPPWQPVAPPIGAPASAALPELPGELPVYDVVPLPAGLLVAHGEHGTRLLDLTGRVRAHWDTPAHALVPSDSGTTAVLATRLGGTAWELHRLDVAARRLRRSFPLAARALLPSYDGDLLPVIGPDGAIDFLDSRAQWPRTLWRELGDGGAQAVAVARSPESMAAVVHHPPTPYRVAFQEVWRWDLPARVLRKRRVVEFAAEERWVLTSTGHIMGTREGLNPQSAELLWDRTVIGHVPLGDDVDIVASGPCIGVVRLADERMQVDVVGNPPGPADVTLHFPEQAPVDLRVHGSLAAVWDTTGRIAVIDPAARRVVTVLRTRA